MITVLCVFVGLLSIGFLIMASMVDDLRRETRVLRERSEDALKDTIKLAELVESLNEDFDKLLKLRGLQR